MSKKTLAKFRRTKLPSLGGYARAKVLSPERRSEISRRGAYARAARVRLRKLEQGEPTP